MDTSFSRIVEGVGDSCIPTKLGLAKGITYDFEKIAHRKPGSIRQYIADYKETWL